MACIKMGGNSRSHRLKEKERGESERNWQTLSSAPSIFWPAAKSSINSTQENGEGGRERRREERDDE